MTRRLRLGLIVSLLAFATACSAPSPTEVPPDEVVRRAAQAMLDQKTMHFKLDIGGAPAMINPALGLALRSAEGDFARPDRMGVHVKLVTPLAAVEADMIALGDQQYVTNFLTKHWEPLPAQFGFNPAVMFHPEFGLERTLAGGLDGAAHAGVESIDGAQLYRVTGSLDGMRLQFMSGGLIRAGRVQVEVWIDAGAFTVRRALLVDAAADPEQPTTWTMTFSHFGETVEIEAPIK
jgi:lipoprotein LprG